MIDKAKVKNLVEKRLDEKMFLVDITVNERNLINIFIDSYNGLTIEQCVDISRYVEHNLDREKEDFELQVSSPGLSENFKVIDQYYKYKGKEICIVTNEAEKLEGILFKVNEEGIELETSSKEKLEGHKKKQLVIKKHQLKYEEIKSAKAVISFKRI
jgi:ribosome maturation factor RimP